MSRPDTLNSLSPDDADSGLRRSMEYNTGLLEVIGGFLPSKVGRKIDVAYPSATTETYTYKDGSTTLWVITVTYTDSTKDAISSAERTA